MHDSFVQPILGAVRIAAAICSAMALVAAPGCAAGHDGTLYVPGGATRQGFGAISTFDAFTPP